MGDMLPDLGEKDLICQTAGKELTDVGQEALDSDNRMTDTLLEGIQASTAIKTMFDRAKAEGWEPRRMWAQFAIGMLRDVGYEDLSLDRVSEHGSQA